MNFISYRSLEENHTSMNLRIPFQLPVSFYSIFALLLLSCFLIQAQNLEVEGSAKILEMDPDNSADQIVVQQADGTLAIRDASSLTEHQLISINEDTIFLSDGGFVVLGDLLASKVDSTSLASQMEMLSSTLKGLLNPVLDLNGPLSGRDYTGNILVGGEAMIGTIDLTLQSNINGAIVDSVCIQISNFDEGLDETLFLNTGVAGITSTFDANIGILMLIGSESFTSYETAFKNVRYSNSATDASFPARILTAKTYSGVIKSDEATSFLTGVELFGGFVTNDIDPTMSGSGIGPVWNYGGELGIQAGIDMCEAIGAHHPCTYGEMVDLETAGTFDDLPNGTSIWLHRVSMTATWTSRVDGNTLIVSPPGAGGRCNDWTVGTNHAADGEYIEVIGGVLEYFFDKDTQYTGNPGDGHQGFDLDSGGTCTGDGSLLRNLACCNDSP